MANVTIAIEDEILKRACLGATEQGPSVNAVVRDYLEQYAGSRSAQALARLIELSLAAQSRQPGAAVVFLGRAGHSRGT